MSGYDADPPRSDPKPGDPDEILAAFARWAAAERAAGAAAERSRTRTLATLAAREATWAGVLLDLAEQRAPVVIQMTGATSPTGTVTPYGSATLSARLVGVGRDFCVTELTGDRPAIISLDHMVAVTPAPQPTGQQTGPHTGPTAPPAPMAVGMPGGRRPAAIDMSMASVLDALAEEGSPVSIRTAGPPLEGRITAVGDDVVTIRTGTGAGRRIVYLRLAAVAACELR